MDINELLRRSESLTENLQKQLKESTTYGRTEDTRFWKNPKDKAGNGYAVIRFLPPPPNPNFPNGIEPAFYVRMYNYGFQGPSGEWYIEKSRRTIGEDDPVYDYTRRLYASKIQANIDKAKKHGQRTRFISNILVIEDPARPENNGKVFLYEYGKKIFDMINDKLHPQFPDEPKVNVFDFVKGANFKLKIRQVENFPNYDRCEFAEQSALYDGDPGRLGKVWGECHSLQAFLDPSQFKSYAELDKKFRRVMGMDAVVDNHEDSHDEETGPAPGPVASAPAAAKLPDPMEHVAPWDEEPKVHAVASTDDDDLEFFKSIAQKR